VGKGLNRAAGPNSPWRSKFAPSLPIKDDFSNRSSRSDRFHGLRDLMHELAPADERLDEAGPAAELYRSVLRSGPNPLPEPSAKFSLMATKGEPRAYLSRRTDPVCLALRRPRVAPGAFTRSRRPAGEKGVRFNFGGHEKGAAARPPEMLSACRASSLKSRQMRSWSGRVDGRMSRGGISA